MDIGYYAEFLTALPLFKDFSSKDIINFVKDNSCKLLNFTKEDVIFFEDEQCKNLSIVLEGAVEIQKIDPSGKVLTVANLSKGDAFGENLLFGDKNSYPMTVVSKDATVILMISKNSVANLCQTSRNFLNEFLRLLSNKAFSLSAKIKEVTLKNIRQKICEFLAWKFNSQNSMTISLDMSKKDWAEKLGVQRPSLSRELIKMKEDGLIDYDKDMIYIKDFEGLKAFI